MATKIILHRIISVVDLTSFLPETWTRITHDEESRRLPLSVKQSLDGFDFQVLSIDIEDRSLVPLLVLERAKSCSEWLFPFNKINTNKDFPFVCNYKQTGLHSFYLVVSNERLTNPVCNRLFWIDGT